MSETKEQILNFAQELIQRRGLNAMSYADLSKAVGIRKASIHHHFPSKQDMVNALLDRYVVEFSSLIDSILQKDISGKEKLKAYFELYLIPLESSDHDKVCLCGILSAEITSLDESNHLLLKGFFDAQKRQIAKLIKEAQTDESIAFAGKPAVMADVILSSLEGGLLIARTEGGPKRMKAIIKELLTLL